MSARLPALALAAALAASSCAHVSPVNVTGSSLDAAASAIHALNIAFFEQCRRFDDPAGPKSAIPYNVCVEWGASVQPKLVASYATVKAAWGAVATLSNPENTASAQALLAALTADIAAATATLALWVKASPADGGVP